MNTDLLYEAITLIDDDLIDEAATFTPKKRAPIRWKRWTALAACLVLVVGAGAILPRMGGSSSSPGVSNNGGSPGADGGSTFMSYAGPVFPLTTTGDAEGVTVQRDLTLDFAPWIKTWWSNEEEAASRTDLTDEERADVLADYNEWYPEGGRYRSSARILVSDEYTLTNTTGTDMTLSVLYPFVSSLCYLPENLPTLTVDGTETEAALRIGGYSGGFQRVDGSSSEELLNLDELNSWEEYKTLLSDGSYLEQALSDGVDLTGIPVTVYKFTDPWGDEESDSKPNPSLRISFDVDYEQTRVLSYGFHSGSYRPDQNWMGLGFSIPQSREPHYGRSFYFIVVGQDIGELTIEGYVTGGWDKAKKLDDFGVTVERYTSDLDAALRVVAADLYETSSEQYEGGQFPVDFETYYRLFCHYLTTYGTLSENGVERYDNGWLESLDVTTVDRVCWLEAEVTVPAGGAVTVAAALSKMPSYDFYCAHTENQGVEGYDMVTLLGSPLTFTGQTATLLDHGEIEIVRQNFGFDLLSGITTVSLDPAQEHYYLEVRGGSD